MLRQPRDAMGQQKQTFRAMELFSKAREIFVKERMPRGLRSIDLYQALLLFNEGRILRIQKLVQRGAECLQPICAAR